MKAERLVIAGILIAGAVALFSLNASARAGQGEDPPVAWHPELTDPHERRFVWSEVQNRTGLDIVSRAAEYQHTQTGEGNFLSTIALAVLEAEGARKAALGQ